MAKSKVECIACNKVFHLSCSLRANKNGFISEDEYQCCNTIQPSSSQIPSPGLNGPSVEFTSALKEIKDNISSLLKEFEQMRSDMSIIKSTLDTIDVLKRENALLKTAITALEEKFNDSKIAPAPPADPLQNEELLAEMRDREHRKYNVVFFGIQEHKSEDTNIRVNADNTAVTDIIRFIDQSIPVTSFKPYRLGRYNKNNHKGRPLKIRLQSEHDVHTLIRQSKKLKLNENSRFSNIRISYDRTPRQIDYYNSLKIELNKRKNDGESNISIKHFNGVPKITDTNYSKSATLN